MRLLAVYRISDNSYERTRLPYATKETCFRSFLRTAADFAANDANQLEVVVLLDACGPATKRVIVKAARDAPFRLQLLESTSGSNGASFRFCFHIAQKAYWRDAFDGYYFAEDDYLYVEDGLQRIAEGFEHAPLVTGYDLPRYYGKEYIPQLGRYVPRSWHDVDADGAELATKVYMGARCHYRTTHHTCMTFAVRRDAFAQLVRVVPTFVAGAKCEDERMFFFLRAHGTRLVTALPAACTHCDVWSVAPYRNWEAEARASAAFAFIPRPPSPPPPAASADASCRAADDGGASAPPPTSSPTGVPSEEAARTAALPPRRRPRNTV